MCSLCTAEQSHAEKVDNVNLAKSNKIQSKIAHACLSLINSTVQYNDWK